jgi:cellulose biosynthesis protein BcsQ
MTIITICAIKGGAGRTTVAQVIAGTLSMRGLKVAAIDATSDQTLSCWVNDLSPYAIDVRDVLNSEHDVDESKIVGLALDLNAENDVVVIDTPGDDMDVQMNAVACAGLVLIPVQLSAADVVGAFNAADLIRHVEEQLNLNIPARVVFTGYMPDTEIANVAESRVNERRELFALKPKLNHLKEFKEMTATGTVPHTEPAWTQCNRLLDEIQELIWEEGRNIANG